MNNLKENNMYTVKNVCHNPDFPMYTAKLFRDSIFLGLIIEEGSGGPLRINGLINTERLKLEEYIKKTKQHSVDVFLEDLVISFMTKNKEVQITHV